MCTLSGHGFSGVSRRHEQGPALVAVKGDAEAVQVVHLTYDLVGEHVDHHGSWVQVGRVDGPNDRFRAKVQHGDLVLDRVGEAVHHDEHRLVCHFGHIDLSARGDAVTFAQREDTVKL